MKVGIFVYGLRVIGAQEFAEASVWEFAEQDVPGVLYFGRGVLCGLSGGLWVFASMEDVDQC